MLRFSLFTAAALMIGVVNAQVVRDPQAAAPVQYSGTAATPPDCDSGVYNVDGSPVISCGTNAAQQANDDANGAGNPGEPYAEDYSADDASTYAAPDFYPGISLFPYGYSYPGFAFGWPYYGFAYFGFGYAFAPFGYWGGFYTFGWGGHYGHYHGPYRYVGHGRYWDQHRFASAGANHGSYANRHNSGMALNPAMPVANHLQATHAGAGASNGAAFGVNRAGPSRSGSTTNAAGAVAGRAPLPSASYFAAAQRGGMATNPGPAYRSGATSSTRANGNRVGSVAGGTVNAHAANPYWVTSLPSRGYAASASRNASGNPARSYGPSMQQRGYAAARGPYAMPQQRYASSPRSYSAGRGAMPSYARGGSGGAMHTNGMSSAHASGISRSGGNDSRGH